MAHIAFKDNLFHGVGSYEERHLWKSYGFRFAPARKAWVTESLEIAMRVPGVLWTKAARAYADQCLRASEASYDMSWAAETSFQPPLPQALKDRGWDYKPFQKAGIEYGLLHRDVLIADQPGLGKTIQAIGIHNADDRLRSALVIVPASLKRNWQKEWRTWTTKEGLTVGIAEARRRERVQDGAYKNGKPRFKTVVHENVWPNTDVVIINYDILERFTKQIKDRTWDMLVCDECHALKSDTSKRTLFVLGGKLMEKGKPPAFFDAIEAMRRVFLSGTPLLNRPVEAWPLCKAFDPEGLGKDRQGYEMRYCGGHTSHYGWDASGATHLEEFGEKLRSSFMVRRLKREVLPELPPKTRVVVTLDSEEIRDLVAREDEIAQALKLYEASVAGDIAEKVMDAANDHDEEVFSEVRDALLGEMIMQRAEQLGIARAYTEGGENGKPQAKFLNMDYAAAVLGLDPPYVDVLFEEMAKVRHDLGVAKLSAAIPWMRDFLDSEEKLVSFAYHADVVEGIRDAFKKYEPAVIYGKVPVHKRQDEVDRFQEDERCRLFDGNIHAAGVGLTLVRARDVAFVEGDWVPAMIEQCEDRVCRIGQLAQQIWAYFLVANGSLDARIAQSAKNKSDNINLALDTRRAA